jgi:hypothetical protein
MTLSLKIASIVSAAVGMIVGFIAARFAPRRRAAIAPRAAAAADVKERWLIGQSHAEIASGTFTERTVLQLLILLRRHAPQGTPVLEFGDFIAHREKDRGILRRYMQRVQQALLGQRNKPVRLPVFSVAQIGESLNTLLSTFGLAPFDDEQVNRVAVCIITLLQGVVVEVPNGPSVGFAIAMSSDHVTLMGHGSVPAGHVFQYPLLIAANHDYEFGLSKHRINFLLSADLVVRSYSLDGVFRCEQTLPRIR